MAKKEHISETPATQFLRQLAVDITGHPYAYADQGRMVWAREPGVPEHPCATRVDRQKKRRRYWI